MATPDSEPHQRTLDDASAEVVAADDIEFDIETDVLVAGACARHRRQ